MSAFKRSFLAAVEEALVENKLEIADFRISTKGSQQWERLSPIEMMEATASGTRSLIKEGGELKIVCLLDSSLFFEAKVFPDGWEFTKQPGTGVLKTDTMKLTNSSQAAIVKEIRQWAEGVYSELTASQVQEKPRSVYVQLDEMRAKAAEMSDEPFSPEEAEEMKQRLNALEEQFKTQIERQYQELQNSEKKERRMQQVEEDIAFLKSTVNNLNKEKWYMGFASKVARWWGTEEGQKVLESKTVKGYLEPLRPVSDDSKPEDS